MLTTAGVDFRATTASPLSIERANAGWWKEAPATNRASATKIILSIWPPSVSAQIEVADGRRLRRSGPPINSRERA
jgi:hypothetical protein